MTRLFQEGRTETVRPCTVESAAFVEAMCSIESNVTVLFCLYVGHSGSNVERRTTQAPPHCH